MKLILSMALLPVSLALAGPEFCHAQSAQALRVRTLAANCAQCHGTDGRAIDAARVPRLAGLPAPYLVAQMKAFKAETRPGNLMPQLAKGYSDAQIDSLAAFFATQKP